MAILTARFRRLTANTPRPLPLCRWISLYYGCSFQEAFLRFWKKYVVFRGRASRSEFWWWVLAAFGINIVLDILNTATDEKLGFLATIWGLATLIPTLALSVRRLHDTNKPG